MDADRFEMLGNVGELLRDGLPELDALNHCGVYRICMPPGFEPRFLLPEDALKARNIIRPWSVDRLERKWVADTEVVYYGLAGAKSERTLRKRLGDLLRHGRGNTTAGGPHTGGEILWQVVGNEQFTIWVMPTGGPPWPRRTERRLIDEFLQVHGKKPFANRNS